MGVANAHLDAHRADPAVPAGTRRGSGFGAAAAWAERAPRRALLPGPPAPRADPQPALVVRRVRGLVVRSDLHLVVRVVGRLRDPTQLAAHAGDARPAAGSAASPGPTTACRPEADRDRTRRGIRRNRRAAAQTALSSGPACQRHRSGEGLPA